MTIESSNYNKKEEPVNKPKFTHQGIDPKKIDAKIESVQHNNEEDEKRVMQQKEQAVKELREAIDEMGSTEGEKTQESQEKQKILDDLYENFKETYLKYDKSSDVEDALKRKSMPQTLAGQTAYIMTGMLSGAPKEILGYFKSKKERTVNKDNEINYRKAKRDLFVNLISAITNTSIESINEGNDIDPADKKMDEIIRNKFDEERAVLKKIQSIYNKKLSADRVDASFDEINDLFIAARRTGLIH